MGLECIIYIPVLRASIVSTPLHDLSHILIITDKFFKERSGESET